MRTALPVGSCVVVEVPATSANLGPGFDALGLALALYDEVEARITGGGLAINVANGTLDARHTSLLNVSSLNVGANSDLIITLNPSLGTSGGFNVAGTATLASGAGLGVRFVSLLAAPTRFTLINAATLNYGAIDLSSIEENSPYLYVVQAGANVPAGQGVGQSFGLDRERVGEAVGGQCLHQGCRHAEFGEGFGRSHFFRCLSGIGCAGVRDGIVEYADQHRGVARLPEGKIDRRETYVQAARNVPIQAVLLRSFGLGLRTRGPVPGVLVKTFHDVPAPEAQTLPQV